MVGKGYSVVVLPTTIPRRPDDKAETSRQLARVLGTTSPGSREDKNKNLHSKMHHANNQRITSRRGKMSVMVCEKKRIQTPLSCIRSRGVCFFPQNYNREFMRARYLPMMSNSRFTTVPTWKVWKLVCSKV